LIRIGIASDHGGYELKMHLLEMLHGAGQGHGFR
jgi:ribose 5-phosphate isomerase RpiB